MFMLAAIAAANAVDPVPIYDAREYTTTLATHPNGVLQMVKAPDAQATPVLHIRGNAFERGEAYGSLMAETVATFVKKVFDDYVVALVESISPEGLPAWLEAVLKAALKDLGKEVAVPVFHQILTWVKDKQNQHVHDAHDGTTKIFDEIAGMAKGVCDSFGADRCQSELGGEQVFQDLIVQVNYLPELIRMSCTMVGATKSATPHGKLVQLRGLDFGAVPFSNYGMVVVEHKTDTTDGGPEAFAHVTFPGFVGVVTGFNSAGLIQSEKVSYNAMSAGYPKKCYKPLGLNVEGCVPGTYDGEGVPFVIRRIVETSPTKADAEASIASAKRTWHVYLGLGDSETMDFDVVGYAAERTKTWTNADLHTYTGATFIKDVTFVNKHVQPEDDGLHDILAPLVGNLTGEALAAYVPRVHGTGDVHNMVIDHGQNKFFVAFGTTNAEGTEFVRKAFDAPVLAFDLSKDIWTMPSELVVV